MAVLGLAIILADILDPHQDETPEASNPDETVKHVSRDPSTTGAAESADGQSAHVSSTREPRATPVDLSMNRTVAHNVIRFLYHEAEAGEVGRAEIEMYLQLRRSDDIDLPEHAWIMFVDALTDWRSRARFATLDDLLTHSDRIIDPLRYLLAPILGMPVESIEEEQATEERGHALGRAITLTSVLGLLREKWCDGRLMIPLDLLAEHGMRDRDLARILASDTPEHTSSTRDLLALRKALTVMAEQAHDEFHHFGMMIEEFLPGGEARAMLLLALQWKFLLEQFDQHIRHAPNPIPVMNRDGSMSAFQWSYPERLRAFRDALTGRVDRLTEPFERART